MAKKERKPLLIVEDDKGLQSQLKWAFDGLEVIIVNTREKALAAFRQYEPDVVTLDLGLPPDPDGVSEGFKALSEMLSLRPCTKVIVASGHTGKDSALRAIADGAWDFYQKPIDAEELTLIVERAYHVANLEAENARLLANEFKAPLDGLIAASDTMAAVCRMIERVAPTQANVMLLGASGTGKELLARGLHNMSERRGKRFVAINCAAIPETLLEAELFGYEKGAFTGAAKLTIGKIESAQGGTLFLDEVGDIPLQLQVKLLRFLQERVIERIGGRAEIPIDVRIVCATHQDLSAMTERGAFRDDLYYRLAEIIITIPNLADREGDAVLIARALLTKFSQETGRVLKGFTPEAIRAINTHKWPGNVRELENKIKRAVILADSSHVTISDLDLKDSSAQKEGVFSLKKIREDADRKAILHVLAECGGNMSKAARMLAISRPTLYDLLKQYSIET